jgi:ABC-type transport system substrate-binding protein
VKKEGLEGFEKRPAGIGSYQYVSRQLGQSILFERVENHWSGIRPALQELERRLAPEESTRLAMLLKGEAHIVDLVRELQGDAEKHGMQILAAEEMIRTAHTSSTLAHFFESTFLEQKYAELTKTLDSQAREHVAREITDDLFDEFTTIPLRTVLHEVAVNPKVIAGWTWPGQGAGRTTHFHLIKAAP